MSSEQDKDLVAKKMHVAAIIFPSEQRASF